MAGCRSSEVDKPGKRTDKQTKGNTSRKRTSETEKRGFSSQSSLGTGSDSHSSPETSYLQGASLT